MSPHASVAVLLAWALVIGLLMLKGCKDGTSGVTSWPAVERAE